PCHCSCGTMTRCKCSSGRAKPIRRQPGRIPPMPARIPLLVVVIWLIALHGVGSAQDVRISADRWDNPNLFSTAHEAVLDVSDPRPPCSAVHVRTILTASTPTVQATATSARIDMIAPPSRGGSGRVPLFLRVYGGLGSTGDLTGPGVAGGVAAR